VYSAHIDFSLSTRCTGFSPTLPPVTQKKSEFDFSGGVSAKFHGIRKMPQAYLEQEADERLRPPQRSPACGAWTRLPRAGKLARATILDSMAA
jgi:hypothetical protein